MPLIARIAARVALSLAAGLGAGLVAGPAKACPGCGCTCPIPVSDLSKQRLTVTERALTRLLHDASVDREAPLNAIRETLSDRAHPERRIRPVRHGAESEPGIVEILGFGALAGLRGTHPMSDLDAAFRRAGDRVYRAPGS